MTESRQSNILVELRRRTPAERVAYCEGYSDFRRMPEPDLRWQIRCLALAGNMGAWDVAFSEWDRRLCAAGQAYKIHASEPRGVIAEPKLLDREEMPF